MEYAFDYLDYSFTGLNWHSTVFPEIHVSDKDERGILWILEASALTPPASSRIETSYGLCGARFITSLMDYSLENAFPVFNTPLQLILPSTRLLLDGIRSIESP